MPQGYLIGVSKVLEKACTVDEVYAAAEAACKRCSETCARCTGYGSCGLFNVLNMKLDAIEVLL